MNDVFDGMSDVKIYIGGVLIGTMQADVEPFGTTQVSSGSRDVFFGGKPISISLKVDEHSTAMRLLRKAAAPDRFVAPSDPTTGPRNRWGRLK